MFVSSSTKKTKFTDSILEEEESSFKPALYHPLLPSLPVFQLLHLHPAWPYWTSRAASSRDAIIHSGSLMSLKFCLSFHLSFLGKEAASGTSTLWNVAVCSWEGGSRGSHPGLGRQVTWVMPVHCQSSLPGYFWSVSGQMSSIPQAWIHLTLLLQTALHSSPTPRSSPFSAPKKKKKRKKSQTLQLSHIFWLFITALHAPFKLSLPFFPFFLTSQFCFLANNQRFLCAT